MTTRISAVCISAGTAVKSLSAQFGASIDHPLSPRIAMTDDTPIPESVVLDKWKFLTPGELRKARDGGTIRWHPGKWRAAWYAPSAVLEYINQRERKCHGQDRHRSLNSPANGSQETQEATTSTDSGPNQEAVERAGQALGQMIGQDAAQMLGR